MKKLLVKIRKDREFGDKHCLRCVYLVYTRFEPYCALFVLKDNEYHYLCPDVKGRLWLRCKECLKAEVK